MTRDKTCKGCRTYLNWWRRLISDFCRDCLLRGVR